MHVLKTSNFAKNVVISLQAVRRSSRARVPKKIRDPPAPRGQAERKSDERKRKKSRKATAKCRAKQKSLPRASVPEIAAGTVPVAAAAAASKRRYKQVVFHVSRGVWREERGDYFGAQHSYNTAITIAAAEMQYCARAQYMLGRLLACQLKDYAGARAALTAAGTSIVGWVRTDLGS